MLERLLDLLYPPKCVFCQRLLDKEEKGVCRLCEKELIDDAFDGSLSGEFFDKGLACFSYKGPVRSSIHHFKFGGRKEYSLVYAKYMADRIFSDDNFLQSDFITSTPTNKRNIRKRGYDHAMLLAKRVEAEIGRPYIKTLKKGRRTAPMFELKPEERRENIRGSIVFNGKEEQITGKSVLLIDDIFTTGATASECARVLKNAGALKVLVLAIAKAEK